MSLPGKFNLSEQYIHFVHIVYWRHWFSSEVVLEALLHSFMMQSFFILNYYEMGLFSVFPPMGSEQFRYRVDGDVSWIGLYTVCYICISSIHLWQLGAAFLLISIHPRPCMQTIRLGALWHITDINLTRKWHIDLWCTTGGSWNDLWCII